MSHTIFTYTFAPYLNNSKSNVNSNYYAVRGKLRTRDKYRGIQKSTEEYRKAQRNTEKYRGLQISTEEYRGVLGNTETEDYRSVLTGTELCFAANAIAWVPFKALRL